MPFCIILSALSHGWRAVTGALDPAESGSATPISVISNWPTAWVQANMAAAKVMTGACDKRGSMSMPESFLPLRVPCSTADAGAPTLRFDRGVLHVSFLDWREAAVRLAFHDVVGFSWDEGDAARTPDCRDDSCSQVIGSAWVDRHRAVGTSHPSADHRHYRLGFNAAGVLQVIAAGWEVRSGPGPGPTAPQAP